MNNVSENSPGQSYRVTGLPGDGIGPEVYASARTVLAELQTSFNFIIELQEHLIGGCAIDAVGDPFPAETLAACQSSDAILLGAVGGPKWDKNPAELRPEKGLLRMRGDLGLFCNLRPIVTHPSLHSLAPLKPELLDDVDIMIVRELTGGIYFGEKKREGNVAIDVCQYSEEEIARVTRKAAAIAQGRSGRITLVDKANVLETSRLWREVVTAVISTEYADVELEFMLVDAAAMHLLSNPGRFDVLLTENLFGDILSDEASMLCGSLGVLPSASLSEDSVGIFEPCHGSAPDIAGQGIANPYGMLLSLAMMLRYSLNQQEAAIALEQSIFQCWRNGVLTPDLTNEGIGTAEATAAVCRQLNARLED